MKSIIRNYGIIFMVIFQFAIGNQNCYSQQNDKLLATVNADAQGMKCQALEEGYYIVVGVFSNYENAEKYSRNMSAQGFLCHNSYSKLKNKYYSYLEHSGCLETVRAKFDEIKNIACFHNAWILKIKENTETTISPVQGTSDKKETDALAYQKTLGRTHDTKNHLNNITATHNVYKVFINVHDEKFNIIPTLVRVVNGEKAKIIAYAQSNQEVFIRCPKIESQTVQLVCEEFGYRKTFFDLDLYDVHRSSDYQKVKMEGSKIVVDICLEKCKKGDVMTMYNVYFHSNSNIMRMKSNYELQKLLFIMNENPELKIKIHGHTNGNSFGHITSIKEDCDNFFNPSETVGSLGGSRKLSMFRSKTIALYLIQNGIDLERIQIKGWGGRKMLYKENSPQSDSNIRVEVEIMED